VLAQAAGAVPAYLGYMSWAGRMVGATSSPGGGAAAAFAAAAVGAEGGPIALFDTTPGANATGARAAVVLAPLAHFKSVQLGPGLGAPGTAAGGVSSYVTALPPGFNTSVGLYFGNRSAAPLACAGRATGPAMNMQHLSGGGRREEMLAVGGGRVTAAAAPLYQVRVCVGQRRVVLCASASRYNAARGPHVHVA
jgi:hypothetical protein